MANTVRNYVVTAVSRTDEGMVATREIGAYRDKIIAMQVAKEAAKTSKDCMTYGPNSLAYYGDEITAVVAW